jgi:hypothetical protein
MTAFISVIPPRLRLPVRDGVAGALFAAAWAVRGGRSWWFSIVVGVLTIARVYVVYRRGGRDTDEGALAGSRADERQEELGLRSRALAGVFAALASFGGWTIAVAVGATWWPFAVIFALTGLGYLFGLSNYGTPEEPPDEDADVGEQLGHLRR